MGRGFLSLAILASLGAYGNPYPNLSTVSIAPRADAPKNGRGTASFKRKQAKKRRIAKERKKWKK